MAIEVRSAEFVLGIVEPATRKIATPGVPEIAVMGRSNVGKSSFINTVLGKQGLARVSSTPGHTRQVNIFNVTLAVDGARKLLTVADLPGFGYAKLSKVEREAISRMSVEYLRHTPALRLVALLVDSKRAPERDEGAIVELCAEHGVHVVVVATKIDRLGQKERSEAFKTIARPLGLEAQDLIGSGVGKFNPHQTFWRRVVPLLSCSSSDLI
ncbi:MAG: ribosome biogenesis GTP-binding protein YsxC [Proteobacteria bacterium]|nr:ribosome biogenesis GTP-binding protein YsxC [Pseudomonadota bacterium]